MLELCYSYLHYLRDSTDRAQHSFHAQRQSLVNVVYTATHCSLKAYCAILVKRSNFRHQASPRVTMREHPAAEGETVGKKCLVILPKMPNFTLHLGIFYMP